MSLLKGALNRLPKVATSSAQSLEEPVGARNRHVSGYSALFCAVPTPMDRHNSAHADRWQQLLPGHTPA